jgi:hypothetical protein
MSDRPWIEPIEAIQDHLRDKTTGREQANCISIDYQASSKNRCSLSLMVEFPKARHHFPFAASARTPYLAIFAIFVAFADRAFYNACDACPAFESDGLV